MSWMTHAALLAFSCVFFAINIRAHIDVRFKFNKHILAHTATLWSTGEAFDETIDVPLFHSLQQASFPAMSA